MEPSKEMLRAVDQALQLMAATLANPREVTPQFTRIWATTLSMAGIRADEVEEGAARLLMNSKFFPTPSEFIEILRPKTNEDAEAELAWQTALSLVRNYGGGASLCSSDADSHILWALDRMDWIGMCAEMGDDNRAIFRANFVRCWKLARERNLTLAYVRGQHERNNGLRGIELTPGLCGRSDWKELPAERSDSTSALPEHIGALVGGIGEEAD